MFDCVFAPIHALILQMKPALRFLLTLFTILCCATISDASTQESQEGVVFEKACVLVGETGCWASFIAANNAGKGLGNPFKGKTPAEIDEMFKAKGFEPRGPDPLNGNGGYVNPKNQRSYHIDEANSFGEPPHVDVNRLKTYQGPLEKKKYEMGGGSGS